MESHEEIRIGVEELIDICSYGIGAGAAIKLKAHYRKYGSFSQIKDILIKSLIAKNAEFLAMKSAVKKYRKKIDLLSQTTISRTEEQTLL